MSLEDRVPFSVQASLTGLGHDLQIIQGWTATFGGAQMIYVDPDTGTLTAAADPRREAYALDLTIYKIRGTPRWNGSSLALGRS